MNRPEKKNAFNAELIGALRETFETLRDQDGVRVVFVQGAGGTFSAGADLEWMRDAVDFTEDDNRDDAMQHGDHAEAPLRHPGADRGAGRGRRRSAAASGWRRPATWRSP